MGDASERASVRLIAPAFDARCRAALVRTLPHDGWRTRFAPAPTGFLHLGHLVNALYVWGLARAFGGRVVLRLEDHDRSRCLPEYEAAVLDDLHWLGLEPDDATLASFRDRSTPHDARQSDHPERYQNALDALDARGLVYACRCSRRDIDAAAPHAPGEEPRYPGTCRTAKVARTDTHARRIRLPDDAESFDDLRLGPLTQRPAAQCGDVLARDRLGQWTYQFCVTVDDQHDAIDLIIRGEDLLASTGRQRQLARSLGRTTMPLVLHHPLLMRSDGAKLSKASRDTSLRDRRAAGASPAALFGEAAYLSGLQATPAPIPVDEIRALFDAEQIRND